MNIALWVVTGFLSVGFLAGGIGLLVLFPERYRALHASQHWVDNFPAPFLKFMGVLKGPRRSSSCCLSSSTSHSGSPRSG